jgi:hypothetical protein
LNRNRSSSVSSENGVARFLDFSDVGVGVFGMVLLPSYPVWRE